MSKRYILGLTAIAILAIVGIAAYIMMKNVSVKNPTAEIYQNGELIRTVSLSEDCEFTVTCSEGSNTVMVKSGAVMISAADCPDKVCVKTGAISGGAVPIVCLPHRLEIRVINGNSEIDAAV